MFVCPHCGNTIEAPPPSKVPAWKYDPGGTRVSLGCGTLILIAIIVAMFSRGGDDSDEIRDLRREVEALRKSIDEGNTKPVVTAERDAPQDNPIN